MSDDLLNWSRELLTPLGAVRTRRMFGGQGLYVDDLFIALIFDQTLYLKVDGDSRAAFVQAGCRTFVYQTAAGKQGSLSYYNAPDEAMDSPDQMTPWARLALAAALRARAAKAPKRARQR